MSLTVSLRLYVELKFFQWELARHARFVIYQQCCSDERDCLQYRQTLVTFLRCQILPRVFSLLHGPVRDVVSLCSVRDYRKIAWLACNTGTLNVNCLVLIKRKSVEEQKEWLIKQFIYFSWSRIDHYVRQALSSFLGSSGNSCLALWQSWDMISSSGFLTLFIARALLSASTRSIK